MQIDGEKLKSARVKMGIPQKALAHSIGVSQAMISLIETQDRHLTLKNADKLAALLSCNVGDFSRDGEQSPYLQITKLADKLTEERQRIVLQVIREFLF